MTPHSEAYTPQFRMEERADLIFDRRSSVFDVLMVTALFSAMLFNRWLGPLTPLTVLALTPAYVLLRWERLYSVFGRCWPLLILPLLAILSSVWSDHPARSLRYGFLYLMTVIPAICVGAGMTRDALLKGMMAAFSVYMVLSLLFGNWVPWGGGGGRAFAGLMASKNASGDAAGLTILVATTTLFWAISRRYMVWILIALVTLPLAFLTLWASKATGALVATLVALPCLLGWSLSRQLPSSYRNLIFVVSIFIVASMLATIQIWMPPLFEFVLESSGKDADLTGRSLLWSKADEMIRARPWLGSGYDAFWVHNNLDAEYLWREMGIKGRRGFNFHNTPRDIWVALGLVGVVIFSSNLLLGAGTLLIRTMRDPHYAGLLCCSLLVFESPRFAFEMIGISPMHFATLIVFILLSYGLRPKSSAEIGDKLL